MPDIKDAGFDFLKAELHTGMTLAQIALDADHDEKAERNRKNARLAYDTVQRTLEKVLLTPEQAEYVAQASLQLKKRLEKIGEKFE